MGAIDPVEPFRAKPRVKTASARTPKTLAQKIPYFIGCDTSDAWPPDASQRYKEYLRASMAQRTYSLMPAR